MMARRKTAEEAQRGRAAGVAKRYNAEQAAKAPLFAWAGLTPTTDADAVLERQLAAQTSKFWSGVRRAEGDASMGFAGDWHRWVLWSLVPADVFAKVAAWADNVPGPIYCRLVAWRTACARAAEGHDPMPEVAMVDPSPCAPTLRRAIADRRWREERAVHAAAGCTAERCVVAGRDRPLPFRRTASGFVNDDGVAFRQWDAAEMLGVA